MITGTGNQPSAKRPKSGSIASVADRQGFELLEAFELRSGLTGRILRPRNGEMARQVRPGWQTRPTGTFDSRKADKPLAWESSLERDALLICEYDDDIVELRTQPYRVEFDTKPRVTRTYPDFEVTLADGTRKIIQVKSECDWQKSEARERLMRDQMIFEALGWAYEIWREPDIRANALLTNGKLLHYYRNHEAAHETLSRLTSGFGDRSEVSVSDLCLRTGLRLSDIHMLLSIRLLKTDLRQPLGPPSVLRRVA